MTRNERALLETHVKSKLFGIVIVVGAVGAGCKTTALVGATGSGGSGTTTVATGTTQAATGNTSATGGKSCDSIGTCQVAGNASPTGDCDACALNPVAGYTDSGSCASAFVAAYGKDGKCTGGGLMAACAELVCQQNCDPTGMFNTPAALNCLCANDGTKCLPIAMQTNTMTCLGALVADPAAEMAVSVVDTCIVKTVCPVSCSGG